MNLSSPLRALGALTFCAALGAAQGAPAPKAAPTPTPDAIPPHPDGLKSKLFLLQYRTPDSQFRNLLRTLGSGGYWTSIEVNDKDGIKAISVRDFPENISAIEEAIKRLDVPPQSHSQVEFHIHILFASKAATSDATVPDELKDVLASLKSTLSYRSYTPVASFVQHAADGADAVEGQGQAEMMIRTPKGETQTMPLILRWGIYHLAVSNGPDGKPVISFPKFELSAFESLDSHQGARLASIETNLAMKDGEKVVVGTSMIRDKALVVVLTAKTVD